MVVLKLNSLHGGAVAQLGARLDGIEEVVGSNPIGSTKNTKILKATFRCIAAKLLSTISTENLNTSKACHLPHRKVFNHPLSNMPLRVT